jgi:hypothetical protein
MLGFPVIAWGAADDISGAGWSSIGTPVSTPGQTDPFGGTGAVLVNDTDAIGQARNKAFVPRDSVVTIPLVVRQGTATNGGWACYDATSGGANTVFIDLTGWSGGVPTIVIGVKLGAMSVTLSSLVSLGGGWYLVLATFTGVVVGNNHLFYCYPSVNSAGGAALTGSTYFYVRNLVLLDVPQDPVAWDEPRPGSERQRGPDGGVATWVAGRDYRFKGNLPWVPPVPRSSPAVVSGYQGLSESIGIGCGVAAMLKAGQEAQDLTFVPDRSDCTTLITSELVGPWDDALGGDLHADRSFLLELRNTTTPYPMGV